MCEQNNKDEQNHGWINSSRRDFLIYAGGSCAAMFVLGATGKTLKRAALLRPPGGQDEVDFISRCIKCDRCRSVCPASVIGLANLSDSVLDARTPIMKFHIGYCDFCNKCVEVCPTHALKPFNIKTVKIGLAEVKKEICIAWDTAGCTICREECPYDAIMLDDLRRPIVVPEKCNGCGKCVKACPALVMRSYAGGRLRGIEVGVISKRGDVL